MTRTTFMTTILSLLMFVNIVNAQDTVSPTPTSQQNTSASADAAGVREIPLEGTGLQMEVAPNGEVAALYENYVLLGNTVQPELLPIRLVDVATGEILFYLAGQSDYVTDAAFSPDSTKLVSYHGNGYIFVWDVATGEEIRRIPAFVEGGRLDFLPDGITIAVQLTSTFGNILLWDIQSGHIVAIFNPHMTIEQRFDLDGVPDTYTFIDVSPDGKYLLAATSFGRLILWELASGESRVLIETENDLPRLNIRVLSFLPNSAQVIYHDDTDNLIHIIDIESGSELFTIDTGEVTPTIAVSPDGSRVAWAARGDTGISIANLEPDARVTVIPMPERFSDFAPPVNSLAFTADGTQLIVGGLTIPDDDRNAIFVVDIPT